MFEYSYAKSPTQKISDFTRKLQLGRTSRLTTRQNQNSFNRERILGIFRVVELNPIVTIGLSPGSSSDFRVRPN